MENNAEELAKNLFVRLDPVHRLLAATIERYKQLEDDDDGNLGETSGEEKMIGILKAQVQLLDDIQKKVEKLMSANDSASTAALGMLFEYILLPIRAIINSYTSRVLQNVRQSLLWRCQEAAANLLTALIKNIPKETMEANKRLDLVISGVAALANNTSTEGGPYQTIRLDRGEEHAKSMLRLLQALVKGIDGSEVENALDGNLLARLVAACIDIVTPPPQLERQDVDLAQEALNTLGILMDIIPNQSPWRSLFPGCSVSLLRRALARGKASKVTASSVERLAQLLSLTMKSLDDATGKTDVIKQLNELSVSDQSETGHFEKVCNDRLPAPLTVLLTMLPTSKSAQVRGSVIALSKALLMDTWSNWNNGSKIGIQALRCCIISLNDDDDCVKELARQLLSSFKETVRWSDFRSELISSLMEIIHELPTFIRSKRAAELQSQLRLARGYLEVFIDDSIDAIADSMVLSNEISTIISSLSSVFDVDFESLQPIQRITSLTQSENMMVQPIHARYRFIRGSSIVVAEDLVKTLGKALGSKQACIFIDSCIANLHESCVSREEWGLAGSSHVSWVHEWIGITTLAEQVLVALREIVDVSEKEQRRTRKRAKALASAVLPLVTTSLLWNLPTVFEAVNPSPEEGILHVSSDALRGNTALICSLLTFIDGLFDFLQADMGNFFPIVLYPLFQKLSQQNHSQVQSAALHVINNIADTTYSGSVPRLISSNFDYLFGAIQTSLRLFVSSGLADDQVIGNFPSVAKAILGAGMKYASGTDETVMQRSSVEINMVNVTIQTSNEITTLFDRCVAQIGKSQNTEQLLDLIGFYEGSLLHLLDSFGLALKDLEERQPLSNILPTPWLELLIPFRCNESNRQTSEGDTMLRENGGKGNMDITNDEMTYLSTVLSRCGHLISHSSLTVRVSSCKVQVMAFEILGFVSRNFVKDEDDDSGENPSNAIYRQISESWPTIMSRVETLSHEFTANQQTKNLSLHLSNALPAPDSSSNVSFLSRLFELIGAMSAASGSFMWRRLSEELWPVCASLLGAFLERKPVKGSTSLNSDTSLAEGDKLLLSLLRFYKRVFSNEELGDAATYTISSIGAMLIPFTAVSGPIGDATMDTLKTMLLVDNDALWRVLLSTSGGGLPPSPHEQRPEMKVVVFAETSAAAPNSVAGSLLQTRAIELIHFADGLPEQSFDDLM